MQKDTFFKIGFFVMLVLNLGILMILVFRKPPMPHPSENNLKDKISTELNFDENQKQAYFKLAEAHHAEMQKNNITLKRLSQEYFKDLNENENGDHFFLKAQISDLESKKIELTYQHFEAVKALCTEEQLKDFPRVLDRALGPILRLPPPNGKRIGH